AGNPDQNHRTNECHDDGADHASTGPDSQKPKDPATQDAAEDAENDVNENAVATTLHHLSSKPTCDQSNHNPCEKSHDDSPWGRLKRTDRNVHLTLSVLKGHRSRAELDRFAVENIRPGVLSVKAITPITAIIAPCKADTA